MDTDTKWTLNNAKVIVVLDENIPSGMVKGLRKHFDVEDQFNSDLVITTVEELDMRHAKDSEILAIIDEHKTIVVTADGPFAKRVRHAVYVKHKHSIKKPTPPESRAYYKRKLYRDIIEGLLQEELIKLVIHGKKIN